MQLPTYQCREAKQIANYRAAIIALAACFPGVSTVQDVANEAIPCALTLFQLTDIFNRELNAALCFLEGGGAGDDCNRPLTGCDHLIVADGLINANALYIYDPFAKGFTFPTITNSNADLTFAPYSNGSGPPMPMTFLTDIQLPVWATIDGSIVCEFHYSLLTFNAPVLTRVGQDFIVAANQSCETVSIPLLATVGRDLVIGSMLLTVPSAPSLTSVGRNISCGGDIVTDVNFPALVTFNGDFDCSVSALTTAGVNHILEMLDGLGVSAHTITLNGGTSATPSGAGLTAKANLIGRGCTVLTN